MQLSIERSTDFEAHWNPKLSNKDYHAFKTSISSSYLPPILKSPATFLSNYLTDNPSKEQTFGDKLHLALLEGPEFLSRYAKIPDFGDQRSPKNRAAKKLFFESLPPESVPVTKEEYDTIRGMIDAVYEHQDARAILENTQKEISGFFADPTTGIKCRIRPDCLNIDLGILADVKTTRSVSQWIWEKDVWEYRYDMRLYMYALGSQEISGKPMTDRAFICIEKTPPFEVAVYVPNPRTMDKARADYHAAMKRLSECLDTQTFPKYQSRAQTFSLPSYAFYQ